MLFLEDDPYIEDDAIGAVKESLILKLEECNDPNEMLNRGVDRKFYTTEYNFILSPEKVRNTRNEEENTDYSIR